MTDLRKSGARNDTEMVFRRMTNSRPWPIALKRFLRVYAEFIRVGFVNTLAYRLRYYTGIVTYFIYVTVYYFIWKAIYAHSSQIGGFDFSHILTYIAVGWIIRSFYFNNVDQDMANQVIEGKLAMDLIKPVNIQFMYVAQAFGECLFRAVMLSLPSALLLMLITRCAALPACTTSWLSW